MLQERREKEEGFTLIELMVVVLIIAILLAIAIPTFLGAKGNANNRAVQSNLRNALTAEKTYATNNNSAYIDTTAAGITALTVTEPAITWTINTTAAGTATAAALTTPNKVVVVIPATSNGGTGSPTTAILLEAKSATGDCFYVLDDTVTGTSNAVGTSYLRDAKCALTTLPPLTATSPNASTATANIWATNF